MLSPLLLSVAVLSSAPESPDLQQLTDRLTQSAAQMERVEKQISKTCTDRAEQLDGDGKPFHVFAETTRTEWARGAQAKAILSAREDGQDVTVREQEHLAQDNDAPSDSVRERGGYGGIDFKNPFAPGVRQSYRFSLLPKEPGDGERLRIHFEPRGEKVSSLNSGVALVEPDGTLVSIVAQPSDYPSFVDFVHFEASYAPTPVGLMQTDFRVDGAGGFLFVHKHYREHQHCGDFSRPDRISQR